MIDRIYDELRKIVDPEIGFDIVSLGFIYGVKFSNGKADIKMTLSTRACPLHELILDWVKEAALRVEGVSSCEIELVWEPVWSIFMATDEVRKALN
ncbi:metal-sulfur cluster assembly factor [Campylobacter corcagiensis]|uniref:Metal-sulfur cluster assembly factor n=1 Tax=Campylobacter corcagiensis TaxID=1448857 RepID=A0A7M1LDY8_9BACT|nr:metal-sulfur cluster assembly factor [Campylobacter corcagiensis]QKF65063.1 DUF59 domain-containing protein [Campylobacter corcagiensis]QOQ86787.1 metal-sulfur cluster assembly factor [Campylobacter corcagiensis]